MSLKTVTLLAAIAQTLSGTASFVQLVLNLQERWFRSNWRYLLSSPIYILVDIAMAVFLFTLYSRQKEE